MPTTTMTNLQQVEAEREAAEAELRQAQADLEAANARKAAAEGAFNAMLDEIPTDRAAWERRYTKADDELAQATNAQLAKQARTDAMTRRRDRAAEQYLTARNAIEAEAIQAQARDLDDAVRATHLEWEAGVRELYRELPPSLRTSCATWIGGGAGYGRYLRTIAELAVKADSLRGRAEGLGRSIHVSMPQPWHFQGRVGQMVSDGELR